MPTTGDATASVVGDEEVSLRHLIEAVRRLDELGTTRLVGDAAEAVHKAQSGGQPLGTLTPDAIQVIATGRVQLALGASVTGYTAPERLRGSAGDRRSDVFSLGVILWESLAHARLFDGASDDAVKTAVLAGDVRPPSEQNANVPAELDAICKKALAKDPADRYQSAKVMAAEISAVLDDAGYPDSNDDIARYLAREFPEGPPPRAPRPPVVAAAPPPKAEPKIGSQTMLGVAPLAEAPAKAEPAKDEHVVLVSSAASPAVTPSKNDKSDKNDKKKKPDKIEAKGTTPPANKPTNGKPSNGTAKVSDAEARVDKNVEKLVEAPVDTKIDKTLDKIAEKPAWLGGAKSGPSDDKKVVDGGWTVGGATTAAVDMKPPAPSAPPVEAKNPTTPPLNVPKSSTPIPSIKSPTTPPAELKKPSPTTPPVDVKKPSPTTPPVNVEVKKEEPLLNPSTTLMGLPPAATKPSAVIVEEAKQPALIVAESKTTEPMPTVVAPTTEPMPTVAPPPVATPGAPTLLADHPGMQLPRLPPGATATPPQGSPTAVPPSPGVGATTMMLGSNASADLQAAAAAVIESGSHKAPEPVTLKPPVIPDSANRPKPSISNAETVPTPALVPTAAATDAPVAAAAASAHELDEATQAASVVSLPRRRRPTTNGTGKQDMLAGWGWGTDSHATVGGIDEDDEVYAKQSQQNKKRLMIAIGGALGAILLITLVAFAFSGGKKDKDKDKGPKEQADPQQLVQPEPPKPEVKADPPKVDDTKAEVKADGSAADPKPEMKLEELAFVHEAASHERLAIEVKPDPAEEAKKLEEQKKKDELAKKEEAKKLEEQKKKDELAKKEEAKKADELKKKEELAKKEEAKKAEAAKKADELKKKEELAKAEAAKKAELAKTDDAAKKAELAKKQEEAKKAEAKRQEEAKKKAELAKADEAKRQEEAKKKAELAKAEAAKKDATKPAGPVDPYATPEKPAKPDSAASYKAGVQQYAKGDTNGALTSFKSALAANPNFAPTWRGIGLVYERLGQKSQAITAFKRYLQLNPGAPDAEQIRERLERL